MVPLANLGGDTIFHPPLGPLQVKVYFPQGDHTRCGRLYPHEEEGITLKAS